MGAALLARFPLGVYQAHRANGQPDPFPDVARLFSALVAAAGTGSTARPSGDRLGLSDDAVRALRWFEENPPAELALPPRVRPQRAVTSYRDEGVIDRKNIKVAGKRVGDVAAVGGPVAWIWDVDLPDDVRVTLDELCADVAYLGESDSPVVLEFGDAVATHRVDPAAGAFAAQGEPVRVPTSGRLDELDAAHVRAHPTRRPTSAADRHTTSESSTAPPLAALDHVVERRYVAVDAPPAAAPWPRGWLLPVRAPIAPQEVVTWCVTFHHAFAARVGEPAPGLVTGRFAPGVRKPANRLAIHYLEPRLAGMIGDSASFPEHGAFVVSFPRGGSAEDQAAVEQALGGLSRLYRATSAVPLGAAHEIDASRFWRPVADGQVRLWGSVTPLVAETRPQPGKGRPWSLADAAKLSVAFVARDDLPSTRERGDERYRAFVAAVEQRGVRAAHTARVTDPHVERYAHKLPESLVAQPYRATLNLGALWSPQALIAVGQSRHLGGGLLAPFDVVPPVAQSMIESSR